MMSIVLFLSISFHVYAKSVYVIHHDPTSAMSVFEINGSSLIFQKQITLTDYGFGAIDVTVDNESEVLFVSYESDGTSGGDMITLVDARTMTKLDEIPLSGVNGTYAPGNVAGLAYDATRKKLYCANRNTHNLYAYDWNAENLTLTPDLRNPINLPELALDKGACGLTLAGDILYVSEFAYGWPNCFYSSSVYCYNIADIFTYLSTIDMGYSAVAVNYNTLNNVLYAGAYEYPILAKHIMLPPSNLIRDVGGVNGVTSDNDTGLVYLTNFSFVEVWNTSDADPANWTHTDYTSGEGYTLSNLAGLCVGPTYKPSAFSLIKTQDASSCVSPTNTITYTLTYDIPNNDPNAIASTNNVVITDYLPPEVDFYPPSQTGTYHPNNRTVTWNLGTVNKSSPSAAVTLTVTVNSKAKPGGSFFNRATIESDDYFNRSNVLEADVCPWSASNKIYVNAAARTGYNNGTSWANAYRRLQDALHEDADRTTKVDIWVAAGTYYPGYLYSDRFELINGVSLYGGFAGTETSTTQRDFYTYKSVLDGLNLCDNVVYDENAVGNTTKLDGFVIQGAAQDGVASNGNLQVVRCAVKNNGHDGLLFTGYQKSPAVLNCNIYDNDNSGIYVQGSASRSTIKNSLIHHNHNYGVQLNSPDTSSTVIRNNTIAYNNYLAVASPGGTEIKNCILWGNYPDCPAHWQPGEYDGCLPKYCDIDPNNVNGSNNPASDLLGQHNIYCPPKFAYNAANDYPGESLYDFHLAADSYCIDHGDNTGISGETDIDGESRIYNNGTVDMGADELSCTDVSCSFDFDNDGIFHADGLVNLRDFALLAAAWGKTSSNPDWTSKYSKCNFDNTTYDSINKIDQYDLAIFIGNPTNGPWLWKACWRNTPGGISTMAMEAQPDPNMPFDPNSLEDPNEFDPNNYDPNDPNNFEQMIFTADQMLETVGWALSPCGSSPDDVAQLTASIAMLQQLTESNPNDQNTLDDLLTALDALDDMLTTLQQSQTNEE
jgi:hypothetical protein